MLEKIKHIVVLLLENRSFDSMLGNLYPKSDQFNGLGGEESNYFTDQGVSTEIKVWNGINSAACPMDIPNPDPGESFTDINEQIFGTGDPAINAIPKMNGFAQNYFKFSQPIPPNNIMHYYLPEQIPILSQLARNYAVCDAWFASAPCQTWPNRFFLHTGTAAGFENNEPVHFPYVMSTIFTRFNKLNRENGWKIYYHDFPHTATLSDLWPHTDQFHHYYRFKEDAANNGLPSYSFIEPRYYAEFNYPNDQHPPHDVRFGEELLADVYNTLQASPSWKNTLLIITYDEHGGCYDHVAPPKAPPPEAPRQNQVFNFDRYGIRVPAVVISPYIKPGTIFRAPPNSQPFDHTSVIATLRECFDLGPALTNRDRNAPGLSSLLTLPDDQLNLGEPLKPLPIEKPADLFQRLSGIATSDLQKSLLKTAAHLPDLTGLANQIERIEAVQRAKQQLIATGGMPLPDHKVLSEALPYIQNKLSLFLSPLQK